MLYNCKKHRFYQLRLSISRSYGFPNNIETYGLVSGLWTSTFALGAFIGPSVAGILLDNIGFRNGSMFIILLHLLVVRIISLREKSHCAFLWTRYPPIAIIELFACDPISHTNISEAWNCKFLLARQKEATKYETKEKPNLNLVSNHRTTRVVRSSKLTDVEA